jgi:hypothetical protein
MGNQDQSSNNLRWNEFLGILEYAAGFNWLSTGVTKGGGITQLTGPVTAGPGTGSQATTITATGVTPGSYTSTNLTVNAAGQITAASNGSGGSTNQPAIQVVKTTGFTTSSTSYVDVTGTTVNITPTNSSKRMKITVTAIIWNDTIGTNAYATITRLDGTVLSTAGGFGQAYPGNTGTQLPLIQTIHIVYIDSPATASPTGYTLQVKSDVGGTVHVGDASSTVIIVEEIV